MEINLANLKGATDPEIAERIVLAYRAQRVPLYSLLVARGRQRTIGNVESKWKTGTLSGKRTQINNGGTAYNAATTSIVVDNGALFSVGHLVVCEATGEVIRVTAVSGNTLTVVRGVGSSIPAAIASVADDAYLTIISRASGEGSGRPPASSAGAVEKSNLCQIFRKRIQLTGTVGRSNMKTEDERMRQRNAMLVEQTDEIEQTFIHGVKSSDGVDAEGNKVLTMGGLKEFITENVTSSMGSISEEDVWDALAPCFGYGSGEKILLAGTTLLTAINSLFKDRIRQASPTGSVGIRVGEMYTPHGPITLVPHYGLTGSFAGDGIVVDPGELEIQALEGEHSAQAGNFKTGRLHIVEDSQDKGVDARVDEWFAQLTLAMGNSQAHGQMLGATGAA